MPVTRKTTPEEHPAESLLVLSHTVSRLSGYEREKRHRRREKKETEWEKGKAVRRKQT